MRRARFSPPLIVFGAVFALIWAAIILVFAVDPLGVFGWGIGPKLDRREYKTGATYLLVNAAIQDPSIDAVMVGSSTSWRFRRSLIDRYLPARNAINLSYAAAQPADRALVMNRLARLGQFKRVIMTLDWDYIRPADSMRPGFPYYLYDDSVFDKMRMVDDTTVELAVDRLLGLPLHLKHWKNDDDDVDDPAADGSKSIQNPAELRRLAHQIAIHQADVDRPSDMGCKEFATVNQQLVPQARMFAARHIAFDVLIMPLSLATYYAPPRGEFPFLNRELALRACAVKALDGLPGVRIFAFDNVPGLADDLANYKNTAHIRKPELFVTILQAIAQGTHRLTRDNVDSEMALLRRRVLAYKIRDSEIPGFAGDGS